MKKIRDKYMISKFKRVLNGLLFAAITIVSISLCISKLSSSLVITTDIIFPFSTGIVSLLLGFIAMFYDFDPKKQKL